MANQKSIIELIKSISGQANVIAVPRLYIDLLDGDVNSAILLSQVVYWSDKSKRKDGWFYKTYAEWFDEIGLSQYKVKRGIDTLEKLKIIETDVKRANGAPTVHYKMNMEEFQNLIIKFLDNQETSQSENEVSQQSENEETSQSLTEITQEITQEITPVVVPSELFQIYEQEVGGLSPFIVDILKDIDKDYPNGWFKKAVMEARKAATRGVSIKYIEGILKRWRAEGLPQEYQDEQPPAKKKKYIQVEVNGEYFMKEVTDES